MNGGQVVYVIERNEIDTLFKALQKDGYELVGPTLREGAVACDTLASISDLPIGFIDEQSGGMYRIKKDNSEELFGYTIGPHSWKKFLFPPKLRLWQAKKTKEGFEMCEDGGQNPKYAFIGVRPCEIQAILIQDKVFTKGPYVDPVYKSRRENIFIVAVNCARASGNCFCVSMGTGPKAKDHFDLALTEVLEKDRHYFVVEAAGEKGKEVLQKITHRPAGQSEIETGEKIHKNTAGHMGKSLDTENIKELLFRNLEHPRWEDVAKRCLSCANCTMVCPTCFCTTVEDVTDLTGEHAERWRKWDSCFTLDFSYIHGGNIRSSAKSRYRQWMTHKLAGWIDQFEASGCVGCGRCITWCPAGIDITEEVRSIREDDATGKRAAANLGGKK